MNEPLRVAPREIYPKVQSGQTLLVCAYDDEAKCRRLHLEGAITLAEFKTRIPTLSKDREIVFYCA
ncbi:MAG: rhodanese-like domain-containing protein [Thermodesulfobacteriota bacterium]